MCTHLNEKWKIFIGKATLHKAKVEIAWAVMPNPPEKCGLSDQQPFPGIVVPKYSSLTTLLYDWHVPEITILHLTAACATMVGEMEDGD